MNQREIVWNLLYPKIHEGHIAEKGINSISQHNLVPKLVPVPKAIIIPSAKVGEARKVASVAIDQSEGQKGGHSASTKKKQNSPYCCHDDGHLTSQECGVGNKVSKVQRPGCAPK